MAGRDRPHRPHRPRKASPPCANDVAVAGGGGRRRSGGPTGPSSRHPNSNPWGCSVGADANIGRRSGQRKITTPPGPGGHKRAAPSLHTKRGRLRNDPSWPNTSHARCDLAHMPRGVRRGRIAADEQTHWRTRRGQCGASVIEDHLTSPVPLNRHRLRRLCTQLPEGARIAQEGRWMRLRAAENRRGLRRAAAARDEALGRARVPWPVLL